MSTFCSQIAAFMLVFLIGGQIENQLLSTGAFEVYLNGKCLYYIIHVLYSTPFRETCVSCAVNLHSIDVQVWSKLESGRLPSVIEMKGLVEDPQIEPPAATHINLDSMPA